jgi:hypothetical protein
MVRADSQADFDLMELLLMGAFRKSSYYQSLESGGWRREEGHGVEYIFSAAIGLAL